MLTHLFHEKSTAVPVNQSWTLCKRKKGFDVWYNTPSSLFSSAPCPCLIYSSLATISHKIGGLKRHYLLFIFLLVAGLFIAVSTVQAKTIYVGMTAAISGPTKTLGTEMRRGIESYFSKVNKNNGIHGNAIKLLVLDDIYEQYLAKKNMLKFIEDNRVIAVIGNVGTPTASVTAPLANRYKMPFFGAFTGTSLLRRSPPDQYIINYRASYQQEVDLMIEHIISQGISPKDIGFLVQDDAFGNEVYRSSISTLEYLGISAENIHHLPVGYYTRNTLNIGGAIQAILSKDKKRRLKAFILVGTSAPIARFVQRMKDYYPQATFYTTSFLNLEEFSHLICKKSAALCANYGKNVFVTQVVPLVKDAEAFPIIKEYLAALKIYNKNAKPTQVSLEGYIVAKILVAMLMNAKEPFTRERVIQGFHQMKATDIGLNFPISFSTKKHQASKKVWLVKIVRDSYRNVEVR